MIRDLLGQSTVPEVSAEILVVGGGTAGLILADRLARAGRRVVVLESGAMDQKEEEHPLNAVEHRANVYSGAARGRFRCLGGTSTRWGGALIPFQQADLADRGWPVTMDDLAPYAAEVERFFSLSDGAYDDPCIMSGRDGRTVAFLARHAKWPPFKNRNVATLLMPRLSGNAGPEVWLNATASDFALMPDGRLGVVTARAEDGACLTVRADEVVIAAGAIESTRLLLLLDRQHGDRIFAPHDVIGRYFHDHLSVPVADMVPSDRRALNRIAGFRFEPTGRMRNLRFELAPHAPERAAVPPCFAHIAFATKESGGFDTLRDVYRQLQKRRLPALPTVLRLSRAAPWLARAAWWRIWEKRLLYPADAQIELHVVIEQIPRPENRISLSTKQRDRHAQSLATIDWSVSDSDCRNLARATRAFAAAWDASNLATLATLALRSAEDTAAAMVAGGGIYHPGGSLRMGRHPGEGVVSGDLVAFGIPNLHVVSTAVFPTGAGANPTMTILMHALRKADRLSAAA